ncbi:MAG: glycosyltransferase family 2 protein [Bacillati bacterium ANGP1]|uniref:Glycosyltransferase family 2 protein n=1 Tax=Candidatus Segetimicrobium genomatis TaxID=2569760 RepID=A0A537JN91_9BACT|nr:MAG: glycosyltransferase family 2 protein [Terrabacteria group bacterium ANGP1]
MPVPAPLVSIIVPAFNAERFVARALRSALGQAYPNLEIIVVDDGSTDRTAEIVRSFSDPRIRLVVQANRGQAAARNHGIRLSAGKYVTFLDADDAYLPAKVERQVAFLEATPGFQGAFCDAAHFYSRDPRTLLGRRRGRGSGDFFRDLLHGSMINPNTLMLAGDLVRNGFLFREDRYYPEEWELCLRLARAGVRVGHQDEALVVVELRDDSNTAMEIQWRLKRHTLEMSKAVLRSCRRKLAFACLVARDPAGSIAVTAEMIPRPLGTILRGVLRVVPPAPVRAIGGRAWRLRQRLGFYRIETPAVVQAWARVLGDGAGG